jgi:hypothetical protein
VVGAQTKAATFLQGRNSRDAPRLTTRQPGMTGFATSVVDWIPIDSEGRPCVD